MLLTKEVEVKITKANLEYFLAKGYSCNIKDKIMVNPFDLRNQSEKEILYKCDCCGKEIRETESILKQEIFVMIARKRNERNGLR